MTRILQHPTYRFLILFLGLFIAFYYFNILLLGLTSPENYYSSFLDKYFNYVLLLQDILINTTAYVLELLRYNIFIKDNWLHVSGKGGFILAYSCLGISVMSFFTAFVIAFPKSLKSKFIFLPAGLIFIQLLNITRFILLALYWKGSIFRGVIDHHDLFNYILYAILLTVMYVWTRNGENKPFTESKD